MKRIKKLLAGLAMAMAVASGISGAAEGQSIILQSTTSTANSGLYDAILPVFEARTGVVVRVVAVGTGQALKNARNGDGDVLLVHARSAEEAFVAQGYGVARFDVMYNDFIIVGPQSDPSRLGSASSTAQAMRRLASAGTPFASRGDNSGTHKKEMALWKAAGVDPLVASGGWYREIGSGMGATLNAAVGMGAYAMTDRGTWISFGNKSGHRIAYEGAPELFNQYGVILVNPKRHPHVNAAAGQQFIDWILGAEGQQAIAAYKLEGQQLFFPNAR